MQLSATLEKDFEESIRTNILEMARETFEIVRSESAYPQYMRIEEASRFMNCSRSTLNGKFVPAGLKVILIDGLQYVDKNDAIEFMDAHKK